MENKDNYQIYIKSTHEWVPVSKEVFKTYIKEIDTYRRKEQRHGRCACPQSKNWLCDMNCHACEFHKAGDMLSADAEMDTEEDCTTILDTTPDPNSDIEEALALYELFKALHHELAQLDPDGRRICELIMQGKTEREIAADMSKRQSTINYQKNKVFSILREALKDFI